jgi:hypothetical protein
MNTAVTQVGSQKETEHKHTYKTWKESFLHVNNYKKLKQCTTLEIQTVNLI